MNWWSRSRMLVLPPANAVWCRGVYPAYARQSWPLLKAGGASHGWSKSTQSSHSVWQLLGLKGVGGFRLILNKIRGLDFYFLHCVGILQGHKYPGKCSACRHFSLLVWYCFSLSSKSLLSCSGFKWCGGKEIWEQALCLQAPLPPQRGRDIRSAQHSMYCLIIRSVSHFSFLGCRARCLKTAIT